MKHRNVLVTDRYLFILIVLLVAPAASAQKKRNIHYFGENSTDGWLPMGSVIADSLGNLYGTTWLGGPLGYDGTVYELTPPVPPSGAWTETVLYAFESNADGEGPVGNLVFDSAGNLFGVTQGGGSQFNGSVFELSPPASQGASWTKTEIYSFQGGSDGIIPSGGLIFDQSGNLYGATQGGGGGSCDGRSPPGCGTVFELSPPQQSGGQWTETILYRFQGSDGYDPDAGMVMDKMGNLYGTTDLGGMGCGLGCGTVFELSPPAQQGAPWSENVLHYFSESVSDGVNPSSPGLVAGLSGALAGTTLSGGAYGWGTAFGLEPPSSPGGRWAFEILHSFSTSDGIEPSSLTRGNDGVLYGTGGGGGSCQADECGSIFELSPPSQRGGAWAETTLYYFQGGNDSDGPQGPLLLRDGALYGAAVGGGFDWQGVVFKFIK
jgi:hypothetical protein